MDPLKLLVAALALAAAALPGGARAEPLERYAHHIAEASQRFGVPVDWIERVIRAESGGRTHLGGRPIVSRAGAMGLMQLMPGTWRELRAELRLGSDPHAPRGNILAGTAYLRMMYDRFGYPGLFAAYNAGPARYASYLAGRSTLPAETRAYLVATAGSTVPARQAKAVLRVPELPAPVPLFYPLATSHARADLSRPGSETEPKTGLSRGRLSFPATANPAQSAPAPEPGSRAKASELFALPPRE